MATTMKIDNRSVRLTIEQKARNLIVFDIHEPGHLAVTSGTDARKAYVVHHNGDHATYCPCQAIGRCCHKVAVDWHLESQRRAAYVNMFQPCNY